MNGDDDKPDVLVGDSGDGGFADGHNDGGIIIDFTPGPDDDLENYDWPGEYAQRFDGVDKGGDTFDFQPQLTSEPTAPQATGDDGQPDLLVGVSGRDWNLSPDTMTSGPDDDLDSPAVQKGTWIMDATFQDGTTVAMEPVILEGHQCLVFFLG